MKRIFDVFLSGTGIICSVPLWILIAIAIKLEDGGNIFFTQARVGKGQRLFRAFKFRSMVMSAEKQYPGMQARENDPRVTKVGKILRATAMDELPQLLNILLGDMSFVGPRALLPDEVEVHSNNTAGDRENELFAKRSVVTPGLTGIAQVFAPRDIPRWKKFRYDLFYIKRRNFWFDLKLIFLSFWVTLRGKWESRGDKLRDSGGKKMNV